MGRKCAVPHCYTGYRKCTVKASLYKVPDEDYFLNKWQEAIAREDRPITPKDFVCEKHFKEDDILRRRIIKDVEEEYQRPKLKPDAIPSIFPELPEYILKMTKKRRKITVPNQTTETDEDKTLSIKTEPEINIQEFGNGFESSIYTDEIDIKTEIEDLPSFPEDEIMEQCDTSGNELYNCDECDYKTKFPHNLRTHKVKHLSGDNAYMSCELCVGYKTKWEVTYLNHMKSQHGIVLKKKWKCPFCVFKTKNINFLSKHCNSEHSNEANLETKFKCEFEGCHYETESKALLNIHSLTHDIPKPKEINKMRTYSCKKCCYKSNSKKTLVAHTKSVHNVNQRSQQYLKCSRCHYRSHSQDLLDKHLIKHQVTTNKKFKSDCHQLQVNTSNDEMKPFEDFSLVIIKEECVDD